MDAQNNKIAARLLDASVYTQSTAHLVKELAAPYQHGGIPAKLIDQDTMLRYPTRAAAPTRLALAYPGVEMPAKKPPVAANQ